MKKLITVPMMMLAAQLLANDCITNVNVTTANGWTFSVLGDGSPCYNNLESYTNLTCRDLIGQCDAISCRLGTCYGTALIFSTTNCPSSANDVATVTWTCNTAVSCAMTQGGPSYCGSNGHFTITMPPGVNQFLVFIYPSGACCNMTWCEFSNSRINCVVSGGGGGKD